MPSGISWADDDYRIQIDEPELRIEQIDEVYARACRRSLDQPGFCLVDLGPEYGSANQRRLMVDLKLAMAERHRRDAGETLMYQSATRFDQQGTTKLHRDGGPDQCFLMLGYEPTPIQSMVSMADYARCAADRGMSESELLELYNPMFADGAEMLAPYVTRLCAFDNRRFQILLINNSMRPTGASGGWLGVLHGAEIPHPDQSASRVINSSLIVSAPLDQAEMLRFEELEEFRSGSTIHRRGYGR
jgi:hypothetical protein